VPTADSARVRRPFVAPIDAAPAATILDGSIPSRTAPSSVVPAEAIPASYASTPHVPLEEAAHQR
jgi:hypothetical protein